MQMASMIPVGLDGMRMGRRPLMHVNMRVLSDSFLHRLNLGLGHMDGLLHDLDPRHMPHNFLNMGHWNFLVANNLLGVDHFL